MAAGAARPGEAQGAGRPEVQVCRPHEGASGVGAESGGASPGAKERASVTFASMQRARSAMRMAAYWRSSSQKRASSAGSSRSSSSRTPSW